MTIDKDFPNYAKLNTIIDSCCSDKQNNILAKNTTFFDFPAKAVVFSEGQIMQGVYLIVSGKAKVYSTIKKNIHQILRLASDNEILGHRGFGEDSVYSVTAETLTPTKVKFIPIHIFMDVLKNNNQCCYNLMMYFAEELKRSEKQVKHQTTMTAKQKIAEVILHNLQAFGFDKTDKKKLAFTLSRNEYKDMAGITYETVIRMLSELQREGLILLENKSIKILQLSTLKELIQEKN